MEQPTPNDTPVPMTTRAPLRGRLTVLALLCAPLLVGGALLISTRKPPPPIPPVRDGRPSPGQALPRLMAGEARLPVSAAPPATVSPAPGAITLKDIRFSSPIFPLFTGQFGQPTLVYGKDGTLVLSAAGQKKKLWQGPISEAKFLLENIAGISTLKEEMQGEPRVLWSNADRVGTPDLLIQKSADGHARILDKSGQTLWEGMLGASPLGTSVTQKPRSLAMNVGGVQVTGANGAFTVKRADTQALLWSGKLSADPLILAREGRRYYICSSHNSAAGSDQIRRVRFETETGAVALAAQVGGKVLGMRPVTVVKRYETVDPESGGRGAVFPVSYAVPDAQLTKNGAGVLTYRNARGEGIQQSSLSKQGRFFSRQDGLPVGMAR